jgi:predicted RNase H-like nuclease (RuvC/YqgF family)
MTELHKLYKGRRITELLEDIRRLEIQLHENQEVVSSLEDAIALVEGQATLAIAKAKLTALLGETK